MSSRTSRWTWLTLFALVNLLCWVGVAAAAGLVVGDRVDLGVETFIREGHATARVVLEQASHRISQPTAIPMSVAQALAAAQTEMAKSKPVATITWPAPANPPPVSQSEAIDQPAQLSSDSSGSPDTVATPEPVSTLVASPLLLADPQISSLAKLDAEMSRSALARAVQIRYSEEALNREIATLWRNNPELPYRDVNVDLKRDGVIVSGSVTVFGFGAKAKIAGTVVAEGCRPQLEIESVTVAGVMTPRFVRDQIEDMMLEAMTWYPADYPLCVEEIVLEETRATVYGYRR
jgi:hypothetical protein